VPIAYSDADLLRLAGRGAYERGRAYAAEGRVEELDIGEHDAAARVRGTRSYAVLLTGDHWMCQCPVGVNGEFCKHCVAVALVARAYVVSPTVIPPTAPAEAAAGDDSEAEPDRYADPRLLRQLVNQLAGVRGPLHDWEAVDYAQNVGLLLDRLNAAATDRPAELRPVLERLLTHIVNALAQADDWTGAIADVLRRALALHAAACRAAPPRPERLARWLARFNLDPRNRFTASVTDYAVALGERGLASYRREVIHRWETEPDQAAVRRARDDLARFDRDAAALVKLRGKELSTVSQFHAVATALADIGEWELAIEYAERGLRKHPDDPLGRLRRFLVEAYLHRDRPKQDRTPA